MPLESFMVCIIYYMAFCIYSISINKKIIINYYSIIRMYATIEWQLNNYQLIYFQKSFNEFN